MKCPRCGTNLPYNATSCHRCGAKFKTVKCPHCGRDIIPGSPFCPGCQKDIKWKAAGPGEKPAPAKKSLTQRWWFWTVCAVLVIGIIGNIGNSLGTMKPAENDEGAGRRNMSPSSSSIQESLSSTSTVEVESSGETTQSAPTKEPKETTAPTTDTQNIQKPSESSSSTNASTNPVSTEKPIQPTQVPEQKPTEAPVVTEPPTTSAKPVGGIVYWTPNGEKYHSTLECVSLKRSGTISSGTLEEAINSGHDEPCKLCH